MCLILAEWVLTNCRKLGRSSNQDITLSRHRIYINRGSEFICCIVLWWFILFVRFFVGLVLLCCCCFDPFCIILYYLLQFRIICKYIIKSDFYFQTIIYTNLCNFYYPCRSSPPPLGKYYYTRLHPRCWSHRKSTQAEAGIPHSHNEDPRLLQSKLKTVLPYFNTWSQHRFCNSTNNQHYFYYRILLLFQIFHLHI